MTPRELEQIERDLATLDGGLGSPAHTRVRADVRILVALVADLRARLDRTIPSHPRSNLHDQWVAPPLPDRDGVVRHPDGLTVVPITIPMTPELDAELARGEAHDAEIAHQRARDADRVVELEARVAALEEQLQGYRDDDAVRGAFHRRSRE